MSKQSLVWIIVVILAIVLIAIAFANKGDRNLDLDLDDNNSEEQGNTNGALSGEVSGNNALTVGVQDADATARIDTVVLESRGFVVVHERTATGGPGAVLGSSALLPAGQSDDVPIQLNTSLTAGKSYIAMLHLDNGDGAFSEVNDPAARDENGGEILVEFEPRAETSSLEENYLTAQVWSL